ncbi:MULTISPECIES: RNA repair transcriptional activator RtcR [unclassified Sphingomonas]|uniref:RNA repair transcriptional activator RtcR n=1 Tax=unclassified Sphingomonas TaxID=196159 RepID=UPI0008EFAC00|nr:MULTISPECIES: RNA repair transcriptional activator RtcR [unclassified Sphingomonas]QCB43950.1 sigma 54-dependent transcriptional regulator [Sphingomonas sp. PAMC26645]SFO46157.1 transcriptional regulatory protein RtcR [Sphingomonas sp. OK281]
MKPLVVIGFLGSTLDGSKLDASRWNKWRPSVSLVMHEDLRVDRFVLLHGTPHRRLAEFVAEDIRSVSPETRVEPYLIDFADAWDFEEVYGKLLDFVRASSFDPEAEDYLVHITTGTHVAQICLFLLTEARYLPGRLLQTQPRRGTAEPVGIWNAIDLDLSRYDSIATRFSVASAESTSFLKSGIETRNPTFNAMIDEIEQVATRSRAPVLLMGPTGAGKSQLGRRIYDLKRLKHQVKGAFVEVNCATLKGDSAMSALFGHKKGSFTGAAADRAGLLRTADKGMLFLDEIGELGLDEQAMILRAIEDKRFLPVGADSEAASDFQLLAGTNRDLGQAVAEGRFRDDLYARLNLWTFALPGLADRREDIAPNLDYELDRFAEREGTRVTFNKEARDRYLAFAIHPDARWTGNFRDLASSVTRMATFSPSGRIDASCVEAEVVRLKRLWSIHIAVDDGLGSIVPTGRMAELDPFDRVQLAHVVNTCRRSRSLSEAGRMLFAASLAKRTSSNDADRLRKYLQRFDLTWQDLHESL